MSDVLVTSTGGMKAIMPMNGRHYSLQEMQSYVGGYIETLKVGQKILVMDEEGKLKGKLPNRIATGWVLQEGINDYICGDVMLIERSHIK